MTTTNFNILFKKVLKESIDELQLFHGSHADFDKFEVAYMSSGWGQQAYGYGFYLAADKQVAQEYARGGIIYTVEVPDGKYLYDDKIDRREASIIAKKFFNYFLNSDGERKEMYSGCEKEFWLYSCKPIENAETGTDIYGVISNETGDDKETSAFLSKLGYTGMILHDDTKYGIMTNYVIFNPDDIKVLNKERNASTAAEEIR